MTDDPHPQPAPGDQAAAPDPWKSFGAVMAATLILEAIVVLLAIPVVGAVGGGLSGPSLGYLIGLAVLLILLAGVQRKPWAIWVNLGAQLLLLAGFAVYPGWGSSASCSRRYGRSSPTSAPRYGGAKTAACRPAPDDRSRFGHQPVGTLCWAA